MSFKCLSDPAVWISVSLYWREKVIQAETRTKNSG